jgi:regulator of protease activity HflC (stomatin/prohibitin superfamily)
MKNANPIKLIAGAITALVITVTALNSFTIVSVGEEAAVSSFGEVHEGKQLEGFNLVMPWWSIDEYNLQHRTMTFNDLGIASQDKFKTNIDVSFTGSFLAGNADKTRANTGTSSKFISTHVEKRILSCLTKAGGDVKDSQAFFNKATQEQLASTTITCVNDYLTTVGAYEISSVQFSDIRLDPKVKSFMVKTKERQEEENQADSELAIAETLAQKVVQTSAAQLLAAENTKQSRKLAADAALYEKQMEAQGNVELAKSISSTLVEYNKANRWDGKMPTHVLGSETTMMLK